MSNINKGETLTLFLCEQYFFSYLFCNVHLHPTVKLAGRGSILALEVSEDGPTPSQAPVDSSHTISAGNTHPK